jgi:hypothetical protein
MKLLKRLTFGCSRVVVEVAIGCMAPTTFRLRICLDPLPHSIFYLLLKLFWNIVIMIFVVVITMVFLSFTYSIFYRCGLLFLLCLKDRGFRKQNCYGWLARTPCTTKTLDTHTSENLHITFFDLYKLVQACTSLYKQKRSKKSKSRQVTYI